MFTAGVLLGERDGALVGAVTMLTFSLLNPYGAAHPLVIGSQVAGEAFAGVAGGIAARLGIQDRAPRTRALLLAGIGALVTLVFDLVTNVATGLVLGPMRVVLYGGILFSLWHIASNVALFAVLGTPVVGVCGHYRARLSS